jgi:predicted pyridoxine 5'-phosphate oxidase superfamily flavin-nucleotide-binding protein
MTQRYRDLAFTPSVREAQRLMGAADHFAGMELAEAKPDELTEKEAGFIAARNSFYMATVSETGWPYIQHRGGPKGFVKILSPNRIAIADFRGNRQYMSVGNLAADNRVSLFFMDYPNRRRLKVMAYASAVGRDQDADLIAKVQDEGYRAVIERVMVFDIEAFDWNCPQHITPRFTEEELVAAFEPAGR